jgi:hypothetical protein
VPFAVRLHGSVRESVNPFPLDYRAISEGGTGKNGENGEGEKTILNFHRAIYLCNSCAGAGHNMESRTGAPQGKSDIQPQTGPAKTACQARWKSSMNIPRPSTIEES